MVKHAYLHYIKTPNKDSAARVIQHASLLGKLATTNGLFPSLARCPVADLRAHHAPARIGAYCCTARVRTMALLSVSDAAKLADRNRSTILRAIEKGHLSASRDG